MAKVSLKKFGYDQVHVSFNGSSVLLKEGQIIEVDALIAAHPQYFDVAPVVKAPKEELLVEAPTPVKVEVIEEVIEETVADSVEEIIEDAIEAIEEVKSTYSKKRK